MGYTSLLRRTIGSVLLAFCAGALAAGWGCGRQEPTVPGSGDSAQPDGAASTGKTLDRVELKALGGAGESVSLEDLKGRVVLLNFWGTWCPPCRVELPHIAEIHKRFADRSDFRLLAVSCGPSPDQETYESLQEDTRDYLAGNRLELPTYADLGATTRQAVDQAVGFQGYPTTLLLDRQGVIRQTWVGYSPGVEKEIEERIERVLAEKS